MDNQELSPIYVRVIAGHLISIESDPVLPGYINTVDENGNQKRVHSLVPASVKKDAFKLSDLVSAVVDNTCFDRLTITTRTEGQKHLHYAQLSNTEKAYNQLLEAYSAFYSSLSAEEKKIVAGPTPKDCPTTSSNKKRRAFSELNGGEDDKN